MNDDERSTTTTRPTRVARDPRIGARVKPREETMAKSTTPTPTATPDLTRLAVNPYPFANLFGAVPKPDKARKVKAKAATTPRRTIFGAVKDGLALHAPDALIIAAVATEFPSSAFARDEATAKRHLNWYRRELNLRAARYDFANLFTVDVAAAS